MGFAGFKKYEDLEGQSIYSRIESERNNILSDPIMDYQIRSKKSSCVSPDNYSI